MPHFAPPPPAPPNSSGGNHFHYHLPPPPPYNSSSTNTIPKLSKQQHHQPYSPFPSWPSSRKHPRQSLLHPHHRTNPLIWLAAILCIIFSLLLIFAGAVTLFVFLIIRPHSPSFDISSATLNNAYLDRTTSTFPSPSIFLNADVTLLTNFSNPNKKLDVTFEYVSLELYFYDRLLSANALQPFAQRRGEASLLAVRMISSEVFLPPETASELFRQVKGNSVVYSVRATLKVRASLGVGHYSYWLYGRCDLQLTAPPAGVLVAKSCTTTR